MTIGDRGKIARETSVFARPVRVADIPDDGMELSIDADHADRSRIADALDLPSVGAFAARYRLSRRPGDSVQVTGNVTAHITQICVVSLEPFESEITNTIDLVFAPLAPSRSDRRTARQDHSERKGVPGHRAIVPVVAAFDDTDPPDPIIDDRIDLGALSVEFLALALDPYPKKPGVTFDDVVGETNEPVPSAFAALERFKDRGRT